MRKSTSASSPGGSWPVETRPHKAPVWKPVPQPAGCTPAGHAFAGRLQRNNRPGFLLTEFLISFVMAVATVTMFAWALDQFNADHDVLLRRHAATLAAESVLERLRSGEASSNESFARDYPGLSYTAARQPADGDWRGFDRVTVSVRGKTRKGKAFRVGVAGYLPAEVRP